MIDTGDHLGSADLHAAAGAARRLHQAHAALRADGDVQFLLPPMAPPTPPPAWLVALGRWLRDLLRPVGRGLRWLGSWMPDAPYARVLLWSVIAIAVAAMAWAAWNRIREGAWRLPRWRRKAVASDVAFEEEWSPDATPVHAWLQEADALAADGHYAEAAHRLLFRSVEDIARRRPRLVRPALTSRELVAAGAIPAAARTLFADIAALVERSLFGGRGVDRDEWLAARDAYTRMTLAEAWRA